MFLFCEYRRVHVPPVNLYQGTIQGSKLLIVVSSSFQFSVRILLGTDQEEDLWSLSRTCECAPA